MYTYDTGRRAGLYRAAAAGAAGRAAGVAARESRLLLLVFPSLKTSSREKP